jgi:hypothetical protein
MVDGIGGSSLARTSRELSFGSCHCGEKKGSLMAI